MTRNQLQYWSDQETKRHNLELEAQGREQIANARRLAEIQASQYHETVRSNVARETELNRTNVANEAIQVLRLQETNRSNLANEAIGRTNAAAAIKQANSAAAKVEYEHQDRVKAQKETVRSNKTQETIRANANPWSSIANTLGKVIPRISERVVTIVDNLKSQSKASKSEVLNTWKAAEQSYRNAVILPTRR